MRARRAWPGAPGGSARLQTYQLPGAQLETRHAVLFGNQADPLVRPPREVHRSQVRASGPVPAHANMARMYLCDDGLIPSGLSLS